MKKGAQTLLLSVVILTVLLSGVGLARRVFAEEGANTPVFSAINVLVRPVQNLFSKAGQKAKMFFETLSSKEELLHKNKELNAKLFSLLQEERKTISVQQENKRLRDLLELKTQFPKETMVACEVIARSGQGADAALQISKGKNHGISAGDAVVLNDGLVGVVSAVSAHSAAVTPICSPKSAAGARVVRTQALCVAEGTGNEKSLRLTFLTEDTLPRAGDEVETSGLGGIYPEGFLLGVVKEVRREDGVFEASVESKIDFSQIYEVMVVKRSVKRSNG